MDRKYLEIDFTWYFKIRFTFLCTDSVSSYLRCAVLRASLCGLDNVCFLYFFSSYWGFLLCQSITGDCLKLNQTQLSQVSWYTAPPLEAWWIDNSTDLWLLWFLSSSFCSYSQIKTVLFIIFSPCLLLNPHSLCSFPSEMV